MNENDIRAAMHNLDTTLPAGSLEPRQVASRVVKRHQWQMRLLAGFSIFLWLLAAAGVLYVVYGALWHFYPRQKLLLHDAALGKLSAEKIDALQATHFMVIEAATISPCGLIYRADVGGAVHCAASAREPSGDIVADQSAAGGNLRATEVAAIARRSLSIVSLAALPCALRPLALPSARTLLMSDVTTRIRYAKNNSCMFLAFVHQSVDQ